MTPEELDVIEARANAATQGPWSTKIDEDYSDHTIPERAEFLTGVFGPQGRVLAIEDGPIRDGEFVAHAREDVPALATALRGAWKEIETTTDENERLGLFYADVMANRPGSSLEKNHMLLIRELDAVTAERDRFRDEIGRLRIALASIAGEGCEGCLVDYAYEPGTCPACRAQAALATVVP